MRSVLSLALAAVAAITILSCGQTEETTSTPTTSPPPTTAEGEVIVEPPDRAEVPAPPGDLETYAGSGELAGLSFNYPSDWQLTESGQKLLSFDPSTVSNPEAIPPDGVIVNFGSAPVGSPGSERPTGASDTMIDGVSGWEIVMVIPEGRRTHSVQIPHGDRVFTFVAIYGAAYPDQSRFLQLLESVKLPPPIG